MVILRLLPFVPQLLSLHAHTLCDHQLKSTTTGKSLHRHVANARLSRPCMSIHVPDALCSAASARISGVSLLRDMDCCGHVLLVGTPWSICHCKPSAPHPPSSRYPLMMHAMA